MNNLALMMVAVALLSGCVVADVFWGEPVTIKCARCGARDCERRGGVFVRIDSRTAICTDERGKCEQSGGVDDHATEICRRETEGETDKTRDDTDAGDTP